MAEIIRATSNTNDMQRLVMPVGYSGTITAYLWGGGGGGGGCDSHPGGTGGGAMCAVKTFSVTPGDVIDVAVGAGGGWGGNDGSGQSSHPGVPGTSYNIETTELIWNSRQASGKLNYAFQGWQPFVNTYGIRPPASFFSTEFVIQENVYFPFSDYYTFTGSGYNQFEVKVDGNLVLSGKNISSLYDARAYITAGTHAVRARAFRGPTLDPRTYGYNYGSYWSNQPLALALTIQRNTGFTTTLSYSGGFGGAAGTTPLSGAGGGGGGATVLFLNNDIIAVAGGGGGGGGGGNHSNGQSAPGDRGRAAGTTAGQNGANKNGDGGGAGGGGGGADGGQGGTVNSGDSGGNAGVYGGSIGDVTYAPNGQTPGGSNLSQYRNGGGTGGTNGVRGVRTATSGGNGVAVLVFTPLSYQIKVAGTWTPIQKAFVKVNGQWKESRNVFVKSNGEWNVVIGSSDDYAPAFTSVPDLYGYNPRPGEGGGGGGGGGCCVVSTAFAEQGLWNHAQKHQLIEWCEQRLHNRVLGECFRRGYQVLGSKALPILKTAWGKRYAGWAFTNGTDMVQGKKFSWWSLPNSLVWISAFMLVGAVVSTKYANNCWQRLYKDKT